MGMGTGCSRSFMTTDLNANIFVDGLQVLDSSSSAFHMSPKTCEELTNPFSFPRNVVKLSDSRKERGGGGESDQGCRNCHELGGSH